MLSFGSTYFVALEFPDLFDLLLGLLVRMTDSLDWDRSMQIARASSSMPILFGAKLFAAALVGAMKLALLFILARLLPR